MADRVMELWVKAGSLFKNEKGQGMVEYALIIVLIAIVAIAGLTLMGTNILGLFNTTAGNLVVA